MTTYTYTATQVHRYIYDTATYNGTAMSNAMGTLAEAYTAATVPKLFGAGLVKLTDVYISNAFSTSGPSAGGVVSQIWESTPNSGGYFSTTDTYYPNGALGIRTGSGGIPTLTYGLDGEGRPYTAGDGTNNLVTATTYNPASAATGVTYGNGDSDAFGYDANTYRPTSLKFNVTGSAPFSVTTALTWNKNASLQKMQITDTNDSTKNQTCTYQADDLSRLASVNCGASTWAQNYSYDPFGNINKGVPSGSTGTAYAAAYSALTNQVSSGISPLPSYDKNGNQLNSTGLSSITWNAGGQPISVTPVSTGTPITGTYDALGRLVETGSGTTSTQFVYSPAGAKVAVVQGGVTGTLLKGTVPLPGGETAIYNSAGMEFIRHTNYLGSSVLATTWAHAVYSKESYAPFGETYNEAGTPDRSFTGQDQDTVTGSGGTGVYDYLFRKYDPSAGRWLSPDPAGSGAVNIGDPQSLDRYAYVENEPEGFVDPLGLDPNYYNCNYYDISTSGVSTDGNLMLTVTEYTSCFDANGENWIPFPYMGPSVNYMGPSVNPTSGGAPNNGPTWSQKNKGCLDKINSTPDGKFYNFFSPLSMVPGIGPEWKSSIAEDVGGGAAKFAVFKFFQGASQTMVRTPFGSMSGFVAGSIEGVAEGVLAPVAAAATVGQLTVHAGCAISAAF